MQGRRGEEGESSCLVRIAYCIFMTDNSDINRGEKIIKKKSKKMKGNAG